ncbi:MAG: STAS domain-containing protein [Rickettsiales bacterium]|nr:STAS domain-containing protein [Pseudomonadota bacterium]MDA0967199.1 STAS domain-containing protein [Pseudomonadota bacterium]MDG4544140.1 STAS domain-containing protein [Rickettsiales bacterium]MDG4546321.1 STAS domain-containing protein [Rickettsiales bacterium]MDG4548464.1 STAS domain-containing protein [Rickettsiales bacterium]
MYIDIEKNNHQWVVYLEGDISYKDRNELKVLIDCFEKDGVKELIIDFKKIAKVQSSGLGSLLILREKALINEANIVLKNVNGHLKTIFEKSALCNLFTIK